MTIGEKGMELLNDLEEEAREHLNWQFKRCGVQDGTLRATLAEACARKLADHLSLHWGGQQVYIPMDSYRRARMVYEEFDGNNITALAIKYGISEPTVYKYIKQIREERHGTPLRQGSLLDET